MTTTISVEDSTKADLEELKIDPRETYNSVIKKLINEKESE